MDMLSVSKAKAGFGRVTRRVIESRQPVVVRTPAGLVQIVPYELREEVPPAPGDTLRLTREEVRLHNHFGDS